MWNILGNSTESVSESNVQTHTSFLSGKTFPGSVIRVWVSTPLFKKVCTLMYWVPHYPISIWNLQPTLMQIIESLICSQGIHMAMPEDRVQHHFHKIAFLAIGHLLVFRQSHPSEHFCVCILYATLMFRRPQEMSGSLNNLSAGFSTFAVATT
jgi:hypothetical protein